MKEYINILNEVLTAGEWLPNRTGIDTIALNGLMFSHDMRKGFPLLTTKKINPRTIFIELEAFIKGITDKRWLQERKCFIWDEWCSPTALKSYNWGDKSHEYLVGVYCDVRDKHIKNPSLSPKMDIALNDIASRLYSTDVHKAPTYDDLRKLVQLYECDLGPVYGYQWRHFGADYYGKKDSGVDQLQNLIETLKINPTDRRMVVSAWNPTEVQNQTVALPACHWAFEVHSNGSDFDLIWHQRSVDVGAGLPFNIASYAMLMLLIAKETGKNPRHLKGMLGNTHIYENHRSQIQEQLGRETRGLPAVTLKDSVWNGIYEWSCDDYEIIGYDPHPFLKLPIAV